MLGEKLLALRKKYGYSQQALADELYVTRQTISNWECGQGSPTLDKALELAKIYHISLDDLLEEQVEIVVKEEKRPQRRLLKQLEGKHMRTKENHLLKKERVIKLIDIRAVNGVEIVEDTK